MSSSIVSDGVGVRGRDIPKIPARRVVNCDSQRSIQIVCSCDVGIYVELVELTLVPESGSPGKGIDDGFGGDRHGGCCAAGENEFESPGGDHVCPYGRRIWPVSYNS